jgi:lipoprotein signal peptidase
LRFALYAGSLDVSVEISFQFVMTRHFVDLAVFLNEGAATSAFSEKKLVLDL